MESLAKPALEAYRTGELTFVPERFGRTYAAGLEHLRDWNVSRQVWWGHQLPVWYTPNDDVEEAGQTVKRNVAPGPSLGTAHNLPPWFSMIERLIERPIPIPARFVV